MIYFKIDNLTVNIDNINLDSLFRLFHIDSCYFPDFLVHAHQSFMSGLPKYVIHEYGLHISVDLDDYRNYIPKDDESFDFFYYEFKKIRIECSGSGLDWIRSFYSEFDNDIRDPKFFENYKYRISRCDFAFDFVNVHEDFLTEFSHDLFMIEKDRRENKIYSDRLGGPRQGMSYTYNVMCGPSGLTIYLGSITSSKFVRMYDKLMESQAHGLLKKPIPKFEHPLDHDVRSWFRIELQTRKKYCQPIVNNMDLDGRNVLKMIFTDFKVTNKGQEIESLVKLMNWDSLPQLYKMKNTTDSVEFVYDKVQRSVDSAIPNLILYILRYGMFHLCQNIANYIESMKDDTSFIGLNRRLALVRKLNIAFQQENFGPLDLKYLDKLYFEREHLIELDEERILSDFHFFRSYSKTLA